jgi:hypothetical protein
LFIHSITLIWFRIESGNVSSLSVLTAAQMGSASIGDISSIPPLALGGLSVEQIKVIGSYPPFGACAGFSGEQLGAISLATFEDITRRCVLTIRPEAFDTLGRAAIENLLPHVVDVITPAQFAKMTMFRLYARPSNIAVYAT